MLPLTGYNDCISAPTGGTIAFKTSSTLDKPYAVDVVRIMHGDPNPAGPGLKYEAVEMGCEGSYPSRFQSVHLGSYVEVLFG